MELFLSILKAFLVGGLLCALAQILIDRTAMTPARILSLYVLAGLFLSALGLYAPLAEWAGAGATVPLTGFGHLLAEGVRKAVTEKGFCGLFTGGLRAAAGGVTAAVLSAFLAALIFKSKDKFRH